MLRDGPRSSLPEEDESLDRGHDGDVQSRALHVHAREAKRCGRGAIAIGKARTELEDLLLSVASDLTRPPFHWILRRIERPVATSRKGTADRP